MTKIIAYNVNGIRSALTKNFTGWMVEEKPDILCLQEIKAHPGQFDRFLFETMGYHDYWFPAVKKGYSGTAIITKQKPLHVEYGCGIPKYDEEGRILRADYEDLSVMSVYMPSGSSGEERQAFKMEWLDFFLDYALQIREAHPKLVICGDFNIAHTKKDIHNPVGNAKSSGFLPEEREWLGKFLDAGFIDTYRYMEPDLQKYSWWSFRAGSRAKNLGWRIDYNMISAALEKYIGEADLLNDVAHSDHCPVMLRLNER